MVIKHRMWLMNYSLMVIQVQLSFIKPCGGEKSTTHPELQVCIVCARVHWGEARWCASTCTLKSLSWCSHCYNLGTPARSWRWACKDLEEGEVWGVTLIPLVVNPRIKVQMKSDDEPVAVDEEFKYLGNTTSQDSTLNKRITMSIVKISHTFSSLYRVCYGAGRF